MSSEQLEKLRKEAEKNPKKSWPYLQFLEDNNINKPRDVMYFGKILLDNKIISTNKRWRLLERVILCSIQCDNIKLANDCLYELNHIFGDGNSKRIKLIKGMLLEKEEEWSKSEHIYNTILKEDSNYNNAVKRKIALLIAQRNEKAAINKLIEYLSLYSNDMYAWKELMNLYLKQHNYELAKFACEELLLLPTQSKDATGEVSGGGEDYLLHMLYAEICYNIGGINELHLAIKYFSQSIILGGDENVRAMYGLVMSVRNWKELMRGEEITSNEEKQDMVENTKNEISQEKDNTSTGKGEVWMRRLSRDEKELLNIALQKIIKVYSDKQSPLLNIAKEVLLQFTPTS